MFITYLYTFVNNGIIVSKSPLWVCQENCVSYFSFIYKFLYLAILLGAALYNGYTLGYAQSLSAASFSLVFSRRLFFWGPGVWDPLSRVRADKRIHLISLLL